MRNSNNIIFNFYHQGKLDTLTPNGSPLTIIQNTGYPLDGTVLLTVHTDKLETFGISLRIPEWCRNACVKVNGESVDVTRGYTTVTQAWSSGDVIEVFFDMTVERILPPKGAQNEDMFAGYHRGPIILAADARITDPKSVINVKCDADGFAKGEKIFCPEIPECLECIELTTESGEKVRLIDYSSAGKTWDKKSMCGAWLYRK
jgi:DUF1680 family protein